jgi:hypothetical protein
MWNVGYGLALGQLTKNEANTKIRHMNWFYGQDPRPRSYIDARRVLVLSDPLNRIISGKSSLVLIPFELDELAVFPHFDFNLLAAGFFHLGFINRDRFTIFQFRFLLNLLYFPSFHIFRYCFVYRGRQFRPLHFFFFAGEC